MHDSDTNKPGFAALLAEGRPILIDGGLATKCEAMGCNIDGHLWSATLLQSSPQALIDAHKSFLNAGAEVIATASYQASRQGFMTTGLSAQQADELIIRSVTLAVQARDEFFLQNEEANHRPLVAASIGPYGAVLHDGSEYTGDYDIGEGELREFHSSRIHLFENSAADLLACETIPSFTEAKVLAELLADAALPAWVSFSCRDSGHLCDGTSVEAAAAIFLDLPNVPVLGVNCVAPDLVLPLIEVLKAVAPNKAIVVYPNSGERYRADDNSWSGSIEAVRYREAAQSWINAGATLVGGCCRVGPAQIAAMRECVTFTR